MDKAKRMVFFSSIDWARLHTLMLDARMLIRSDDGSVAVGVERVRTMLVLTAIHGVMKIETLLPTVLVREQCHIASYT